MELLKNLCADMEADRTWADEGLSKTNICAVYL